MKNDSGQFYDPDKLEMKMPEEDFLAVEEPTKKVSILPYTLIILVIILLIILGALLWWGTELLRVSEEPVPVRTELPTPEENNEPESTNAEAEVETIQAVSTSKDLDVVEADLLGTDIDNLDKELQTIEQELNQ